MGKINDTSVEKKAATFLEEKNILNILNKYGEPSIVGSFQKGNSYEI